MVGLTILLSAIALAPPALAYWSPPDSWFAIPSDFPSGLHKKGISEISSWCDGHMRIPPEASTQHYGSDVYQYCIDFATSVLNHDRSRQWDDQLNRLRQGSQRWRFCMEQNHDQTYCDRWTPIP